MSDTEDLVLTQPVALPGDVVALEPVYELTPEAVAYLAGFEPPAPGAAA